MPVLGLPLNPGMTTSDVREALGTPSNVLKFVEDRTTYEFLCGDEDCYKVSCTVHNQNGLVYVVMMISGIVETCE